MTTAPHEPTDDWAALDDDGPRLSSVPPAGTDDEVPRVPGRPRYQMLGGPKGVKQTPDNVRFLRSNLGTGPLSWAFLRAGRAVRVSCIGEDTYLQPSHADDENGPATVGALTGQVLSTLMADAYFCYVEVKDPETKMKRKVEEWFPAKDGERALELVESLPMLRPLRGVTHTPILRKGGGLITVPGYDAESGFLYQPDTEIPAVPAAPTAAELAAAVALVRGLVADFSWVGEHDEGNYIGGLLTPLMRLVTPPPYKLLAIGAHQRGSGKSLLAQLLRIVHGGTLRSWPGTEEELGKQITSILSGTTAPVCQIDNIRGLIRSAKLEALITSDRYSDRILGSTNDTTMINDRLWVATGNNMVLGGDMDRRAVWATIDPGVERPEDRTDFTIKDLPRHVAEHRGEILHALLTMLAAWDAAGRPTGEPTADSFGAWVAAVRGILAVAGVPGTFDHAESRPDRPDPDAEDAAGLLEALHAAFGDRTWTCREVANRLGEHERAAFGGGAARGALAELADAVPTAARGKTWRPGTPLEQLATPLGYYLRNREGQWFGGFSVRKVLRDRDGVHYAVQAAA